MKGRTGGRGTVRMHALPRPHPRWTAPPKRAWAQHRHIPSVLPTSQRFRSRHQRLRLRTEYGRRRDRPVDPPLRSRQGRGEIVALHLPQIVLGQNFPVGRLVRHQILLRPQCLSRRRRQMETRQRQARRPLHATFGSMTHAARLPPDPGRATLRTDRVRPPVCGGGRPQSIRSLTRLLFHTTVSSPSC